MVTNLPGRNTALRMRLWRGLRTAGAASIRDGVYLLPSGAEALSTFKARAAEVTAAGGSVYLLPCDAASAEQDACFRELFDRTSAYSAHLGDIKKFVSSLRRLNETAAHRGLERLDREVAQTLATDYFPGAAQGQAHSALADARLATLSRFAADEPHAERRRIVRRDVRKYSARTWVTRERLWIDRVCSAWLIRRFIDRKARFVWLKDVRRRPKRSVGFDFDGADFTHVEARVTFEVLLHSFGFESDEALATLGGIVHYLDVGGVPVAEAAGLAAIVSGARALAHDDDALLEAISPVLDKLYAAFATAQAG